MIGGRTSRPMSRSRRCAKGKECSQALVGDVRRGVAPSDFYANLAASRVAGMSVVLLTAACITFKIRLCSLAEALRWRVIDYYRISARIPRIPLEH